MRNGERERLAANLLRQCRRIVARRRVEHERELLAAVARAEVEWPFRRARDDRGHAANAGVAGLVAVEVVERLEVIDVDEDDLQRFLFSLCLQPKPIREAVEHAPVVEAASSPSRSAMSLSRRFSMKLARKRRSMRTAESTDISAVANTTQDAKIN